jgi:SAM-dependent methyltransferase
MDSNNAADDWSAVAPAWEAEIGFVDQTKEWASDSLVAGLEVRPGHRVLELAAGPGSLGEVLASAVGGGGSVVLSDIAPAMVELARRRCAHLPSVSAEVVDASAIDLPDASFDAVACRMGLMFTPDPAVALAEVNRVLKPGGRLGSLTWAGMEHNPWMTCVGMAAAVAGVVSGGPPVRPGGIFSLGDPVVLEDLAEAAGFDGVEVTAIDTTFEADSLEAHVRRVSALAGPLAAALGRATDDQRAALLRTAADLAAPHTDSAGRVSLPARALLLTGTKVTPDAAGG